MLYVAPAWPLRSAGVLIALNITVHLHIRLWELKPMK